MDQYILEIKTDILLIDAMDLVQLIEEYGGKHLQVYAKAFQDQIIDEISTEPTEEEINWATEEVKKLPESLKDPKEILDNIKFRKDNNLLS